MTSIAFTGDITFSKYMKDAWKKENLLDSKIVRFLHSAEHVVANVECTLSNNPIVGGGLKHASDPKAGAFIRDKVNSRIWSLANNHILDCKAPGLLDTLQVAEDYGCQTIGAGINREAAAKPVFIDTAGGIGIFSVSFSMKSMETPDDEPGVFLWKDAERIQKTITQIKSRCRWCVMVVHGQNCEFTDLPLPISRDRMISFLDMGADIVVGHHPHVVQNYERFGDKMIFYSLGNFIFDTDYQRQRPYTQFGMLLKLNFTEDTWTWESQPILIDRQENRIVAGEKPAIFTEIDAHEFDLLKDLVYADFLITNRASRKYLNAEKYGAYTEQDWYDYDARWMGTEGADLLRQGAKRAELGLWKNARKELIEYIGKNLPFVVKERKMTSIAFTGDISFSKYMKESWQKEDLLDEQVTEFLHSADHVVANVECTLSNAPTTSGGLKHSSDPRAGAFIRDKVGSKIWTLANNHILDCKAPGLLDTLQAAKDHGCQTIGAGVNKDDAAKPVFIDAAGGIGIFSVVYDVKVLRTEENEPGVVIWNDVERIQRTIDLIKSKCRWCVMVVHGQRCEFTQLPLPAARKRMLSFLDMGADVIVGHHPHVVQNYEKVGEKMVFYSLGNFIFDTDYQRIQNYTDCGMLLKLNFTEDSWTWENQPIHIDRENNRIVAGQNPVIFTHIGEEEYENLSDLAYSDFMVTDRRSRLYINAAKYGAFTEEQWFTYDAERMTEQGAKDARVAVERAKLGAWKQARPELVQYIGKDLDFVK